MAIKVPRTLNKQARPSAEPHWWAEIYRQFREEGDLGYMKIVAVEAAGRCRCGRVSCPSCGFMSFIARTERIENRRRVKVGYLTGGVHPQ